MHSLESVQAINVTNGFEEVAAQLEQNHGLVLVGTPGSGKSVLARGVTAFAAQAFKEHISVVFCGIGGKSTCCG